MWCVVCDMGEATAGLLCEECQDELARPDEIVPEQIVDQGAGGTDAVLVDPWGRPWRLDARMLVGRDASAGLMIIERSISRHHAQLGLADDAWLVRDLGSANGTTLNDLAITEPTPLRRGDRVGFGSIGLYFLDRAGALPPVELDPAVRATVRPEDREPAVVEDEVEREITNVGLPALRIRLHEPSGGGGGFLEIRNRRVQVSDIQFALVKTLHDRMAAEVHQPDLVRGFVRSSELVSALPWDTHDPLEANLKQLVRRTRRALIKAEIGDLIEARQRFGYRLRAIPKP